MFQQKFHPNMSPSLLQPDGYICTSYEVPYDEAYIGKLFLHVCTALSSFSLDCRSKIK